MAQFYGRDMGYNAWHLELPIEQIAQKELKKGDEKTASIKATAKLVQAQRAGHLNALNNNYKLQRQSLQDANKVINDNYSIIFDQEQKVAKREFENLQKSRGNPGPKQVQGLGSLMELAPALASMVGNYVEQEKIHRNKTTTDLFTRIRAPGNVIREWEANKELIESNTTEAILYRNLEATKLGVRVTQEEMLSILDLYGQRDITAMTAIANNSAPMYQSFLASNDNMEIVLDGGVTQTWGQIRRSNNSEYFETALAQMRGQFMTEHQISAFDTAPGHLDSIAGFVNKVEASERGRFHNALAQSKANLVNIHEDTEFNNSLYEGAHALAELQLKRAWILGDGSKPEYAAAKSEMYERFEKGIESGVVSSAQLVDYKDLMSRQPQGWSPYDAARVDELIDDARVKEHNGWVRQNQIEQRGQDAGIQEAVRQFHSPDGWNGTLQVTENQYRAMLSEQGLTPDSVSKVLSLTMTGAGQKANLPEEKYKAVYDAGEKAVFSSGRSLLEGQDIVLGDSESWETVRGSSMLKNLMRTRYNQEFHKLLSTVGDSDPAAIAQQAKINTVEWLKENPQYSQLTPSKKINEDGDEVTLANKDREFVYYNEGKGLVLYQSLAIDELDNIPGVNSTDRMLGIADERGYKAVIAREHVGSYYQGGRWNVTAFENSSLGRELSKRTGLPASYILAIHADEYGMQQLSDQEFVDLEEFYSLPEGVKRVMIHNSSVSADVTQAALNPNRQFSAYTGVGGGPLNPGFQRTNAVLEPNEDAPYNLMGGTPNARAHLAAINLGESGGPSKHIKLVGGALVPELLNMSIQEVYNMAYYNPDGSSSRIGTGTTPSGKKVKYGADSHAAGAYQFHPDTMIEAAKYGGIPLGTKFTYRTQQLLALAWAKKLGANLNDGPTLENYKILGSSGGWEAVGKMTYQEYVNHFNRFRQSAVHPGFSNLGGGMI